MFYRLLCVCVLTVGLGSCSTVKPYEKEYLLHPLMDDGGVSQLGADLMNSASAQFEKLAVGAAGSGGATSCPTCGG